MQSVQRIVALLMSAGFAALLFACSESRAGQGGSLGGRTNVEADDPAEFGSLPGFELTSQAGRPVTLESLLGEPCAIAAIFTTCYGPCPRITANMRRLQDELAGSGVRLVSVSVDPETDTPEVLAAYAESYEADTESWTFLTGEEAEVYRFVREGLALGVARADTEESVVGQQVTHATRIVAVDRQGRRRGWYDGEDAGDVRRLRDRLLHLAHE